MIGSFTGIATSFARTSAIAAAAMLLSSSLASAQDTQMLPRPEFHFGPYSYGPGYHGWAPYRSSTLQEGLLHGYSDYLRSLGQGELFHYEALRSREAAVEHALDNSIRRLNTRQARQLMGLQHRETLRRMERDRRTSAASQRVVTESVDSVAEAERRAANKLHLSRSLLDEGCTAKGRTWLREIVEEFPDTAAAAEAQQLLARR